MSKVLRVRLKDDIYDLVKVSAKASARSLSGFASELIGQAIKQEMKEISTLNKLLRKLESLEVDLPYEPALQYSIPAL